MTWLDDVKAATAEAESPKKFIFWAGLCTISAVVKNNVYLDKHYYKLYSNIYVMLLAKSGMRKGFPVWLAEELAGAVGNTRVISGQNSIQGIIKELSTSRTRPDGGPPITDAAGLLISGEFSAFIIDAPDALPVLTDLYDGHYHKKWNKTLRNSAQESLSNINLTMLGATNPDDFKTVIPVNAIGGGFVARTIIISVEKRDVINDLIEKPEVMFDTESLLPYLRELSKIKGQFVWSQGAKDVYRPWYREHSMREKDDKTGMSERLHDHILKTAMLLSLSRDTKLILMEEDVSLAIDYCIEASFNVTKAVAGQGRNPLGNMTGQVLQDLLDSPKYQVTRSKILKKYYGDISAADLDSIVETLVRAKAIKMDVHGDDTWYMVLPETIRIHEESKNRVRR